MKRPKHYSKIDPIALMEAQFTSEQLAGFFAGNVLKYVARAGCKDGHADLLKAKDYMDRLEKLGRDPALALYRRAAAKALKKATKRGKK